VPRIGHRTDRATSDDATYVGELVAYIQARAQSALGAVAFGRSGEAAFGADRSPPDGIAAFFQRLVIGKVPPPPIPPPLVEQSDAVESWMLHLAAKAALEYFAIRVARLLDEPEHGVRFSAGGVSGGTLDERGCAGFEIIRWRTTSSTKR
jgi:hypothetical protein